MRATIKSLISAYQLVISPILRGLGASCRFYPACSSYAKEAFDKYPAGRATALVLKRLMRCGPWHPGGVDLLP